MIIVQMAIDAVLIFAIVLLLFRLRQVKADGRLQAGVDGLEAVLNEAHRASEAFQRQLAQKQSLASRVVETLDAKIVSLNLQLNRADMILKSSDGKTQAAAEPAAMHRHRRRIVQMAESGRAPADIARRLSVPKEEVRMVLELTRRLADSRRSKKAP